MLRVSELRTPNGRVNGASTADAARASISNPLDRGGATLTAGAETVRANDGGRLAADGADRVTLVVCFAGTSGRSRRADGFLAQILQRRRNHETFRVLRVDAAERPDLLARLAVTELPTLVVVARKRVVGRLVNPRGCAEIASFLGPWLR
jgi:hypothetical protein